MSGALTRAERDALVKRVRETEARLYPPPEAAQPSDRERDLLRESYYLALAEYFDRLPRVTVSVCPFTGEPLRRAIDPFGLDGFWWHQRLLAKIDEPAAPGAFQVLLGALDLHGRAPAEAIEGVNPGPEVPFVVPRLLQLPGMVAVVHRLQLESGDTAHTIAYFSNEPIPPDHLHQFWLRLDFWFKTEDGDPSWLIANDPWDFELAPYAADGRLRWVREGADGPEIAPADAPNPYVGLPGERAPQSIGRGERELMDPPDGSPIVPFETA